VSTDEVYGSVASGSWTEDTRLDPSSAVLWRRKAGGDLIVGRVCPHARAGCQHHAVLQTITGPYQFPEKVIPLFATNLLDGLKVPLYGDGLNRPRLGARR